MNQIPRTKPMQVEVEEVEAQDVRQGQILVLDNALNDVLLVEREGDVVRLYTALVTKEPARFDQFYYYKPLELDLHDPLTRACV